MPLENAPVGSPGFSRNVSREVEAGKPQKQAVAIAYSKARRDEVNPPWPGADSDYIQERISVDNYALKGRDDDLQSRMDACGSMLKMLSSRADALEAQCADEALLPWAVRK